MNGSVSGVLLAGGQGQRVGGRDKGLIPLNGREMIAHAIERFSSQVDHLAISANRNLSHYETFGYPVLSDDTPDFDGPLAGIYAGLRWCTSGYLAVAPCDSPLLPHDLVDKLYTALTTNGADIAIATNNGMRQPVFALLARSLADSLAGFLAQGERKIGKWYESEKYCYAEFDDINAFININTPEDLVRVEGLLS